MAIVYDGAVDPEALVTFIREVPQSSEFGLNQVLPDRYFTRNKISWDEITRTNRVARFRTWDSRLHVSHRDSGSSKEVQLPPLSTSLNMGEYEKLQLDLAVRIGGGRQAVLAQAVYDDTEHLTGEVLNRMELARGDVLTDFKFEMLPDPANDEPIGLEVDYVAPEGHLVSPATLWSDVTTSTPFTDLRTWRDQFTASNGRPPTGLRTSQRVISYVQQNKEIVDSVFGSTAGRLRVTRNELNELLASEGLPPFTPYDALVDVDGVDTRIVPDDRVLITGPNLGYTAWGVTATALELVNSSVVDFSFELAQGIVGVIEKVGPPYREFIYVDACGMPVITNPRALMVADVL